MKNVKNHIIDAQELLRWNRINNSVSHIVDDNVMDQTGNKIWDRVGDQVGDAILYHIRHFYNGAT